MTRIALALVLLAAPLALGQSFRPGGPTADGTRATCDPPTSTHIRNVGGSDGAGLCVFTSAELASRWQASTLDGFQAWMRRRPGGGWPEKLDQELTRFCREQRRTIPEYIQHTGGDEEFLELAVRTGRMPCVTYAGRDDFYSGRIAHMVNLAHIDADRAAIIDNNRPGVWVWMTRRDFLSRWRDMNGGWAFVLLDPPPPPYPAEPRQAEAIAAACGCDCGPDCRCGPGCRCESRPMVVGQCWGPRPAAGPVASPFAPFAPIAPSVVKPTPFPAEYNLAAEHVLKGNRITLVVGPPPAWFRERDSYVKVFRSPSFAGVADGVYSCWREAGEAKMKRVNSAEDLPPAEATGAAATENHGIDTAKVHSGKKWYLNGAEVDKSDAMRAVGGPGLVDDSDRWFLVCVGTDAERAKFADLVAKLDPATRAKIHARDYSPADWPVTQFEIPRGVTMRKPARGRVGAEAGRFAGELDAAALGRFVRDSISPPPAPMPPPPPATPDTTPATPAGPTLDLATWLAVAVLAALGYIIATRRK